MKRGSGSAVESMRQRARVSMGSWGERARRACRAASFAERWARGRGGEGMERSLVRLPKGVSEGVGACSAWGASSGSSSNMEAAVDWVRKG